VSIYLYVIVYVYNLRNVVIYIYGLLYFSDLVVRPNLVCSKLLLKHLKFRQWDAQNVYSMPIVLTIICITHTKH